MARAIATCPTEDARRPHRADAPPPPARGAAHRGQVYPRPWTSACSWRAGAARPPASTCVARVGRQVVGYAGLMLTLDDGHVTTIAVDPTLAPPPDRHPAAARAVHAGRIGAGAPQPDPRGAGVATTGAQALYRRFGFAPGRRPQELLRRDQRGRPRHVGPRRRRRRRTPRRLDDASRRRVPGHRPTVEDVAVTRLDGRHAGARHRDVAATRRRRPSWSTAPTCCRRWCRARSTSTPASAASCPRSPAGPTSSCSSRSSPRRWSRRASTERDIDAVAATVGPGLIGSLLVGVSRGQGAGARVGRARSSASTTSRPTSTPPSSRSPTLEPPLVVLLVSGGHTMLVDMEGHGRYRLLGQTIDDAAGEAFDKVARFLGLGYPGGPGHRPPGGHDGDPRPSPSPGRMLDEGYDFSFSGLKTAVVNHVRKHPEVADRRRGRLLPGGRGRRAASPRLARAAGRGRRPRPVPGRRGGRQLAGCASGCSTPATADGLPGLPARAGPCAPTTRP